MPRRPQAKEDQYLEEFSTEGALAHFSGSIGVNLSAIVLDESLVTMDTRAMRGSIKGLIESTPD